MRTPIRDQLGLNDPEFAGSEASQREMRLREAAERDSLRSGLAGLPVPKNEYQIMVPEVPSNSPALGSNWRAPYPQEDAGRRQSCACKRNEHSSDWQG